MTAKFLNTYVPANHIRHGIVQISSYPFEILFDLIGPSPLDETLLNDEKLAIATLPSTPIILHVAGWDSLYYDFGVPRPGLLVLRGWCSFTLTLSVFQKSTVYWRKFKQIQKTKSRWPAQHASQLEGLFLLNDGLLPPAIQIEDDGALHVQPPDDSCELARVCEDLLKGIGTVVSPTEGRSATDIEDIKNITSNVPYHFRLTLNEQGPPPFLPNFSMSFRQGVVSSYYDDEVDEKTAIVHLRDLRRNDAKLFSTYVPSSLLVLQVPIDLTQNYALNMSSTLPLDALRVAVRSHVRFEQVHLLGPLALLKRGVPPINIMGNGTLDAQPHSTLARTRKHLIIGLRLVAVTSQRVAYFSLIYSYDFKNDCLSAMSSAVACLTFILRSPSSSSSTLSSDEGVTTSHKADRGHHTLQNQRQHPSDTQNVDKVFIEISDDSDSDLDVPLLPTFDEASGRQLWGWKPPPFDHGSQPLFAPLNRGLLPTTPARRPEETELLKKTLLTCLPGPSAPEPKSPITLMSTQLRVLNASHLSQQLSTKHKDIKHTRFLLSLRTIPRSGTKTSISDISLPPVPLTYAHHLRKPRVGPLSLRICISIGKDHLMSKCGSGNAMADARQPEVVPGVRSKRFSHPRLPEHQFQMLKSAGPTWIMKSTGIGVVASFSCFSVPSIIHSSANVSPDSIQLEA
ncbi:uncharacterized protein LACBIDRAFT_328220 [Laccaria bicolor S238N-H82]|uniref:Predicted protein n=1 Tax=Laccaria bicolor (strain S238N-H82 / ATCC MYA-4686) TaxID=486041 RepID=B0DE42_LACBS|nr:uncharacterized protein LACBIDRAFT_328220 [Laccaria bicolor S238N-H82]EDR07321.1 predicted protein [Laccaria bicolor S238N-H82]|eukprot:XP_001882252.1 predicted protein [Laccaria bicolor S238N-H82]